MNVNLGELLEYTEWERRKWHDWLQPRGDQILKTSVGPHGDGRFQTVGEVIRHVFGAEKRYVERLSDRPLTDPTSVPAGDLEALFAFGQQSRKGLEELLETFPAQAWDVPQDYKDMNHSFSATPRKIVIHVVTHEIRHWAQIATLLRFHGLVGDFHDFLFSPVLGGGPGREPTKSRA